MKTVPTDLLAQLGSEPQPLLTIYWDGVTPTTYTRDSITNDLNLKVSPSTKTGSSSSVGVELEDTEGTLKSLIDTTDIHKVPAIVALYGEDPEDSVTLFTGEITGPITWSEAQRTVSFTIESKIEDREVGFSLEESSASCNKESIGKPWPLCFGNVKHVPAVKVDGPQVATLLDQMGIVDPLIQLSLTSLENAAAREAYILRFYTQVLEGVKRMVPDVLTVFQLYVSAIKRKRVLIDARDRYLAGLQRQAVLADYEDFMTAVVGGKWKLKVWRAKLRKQLDGAVTTIWSELELVGNWLADQVAAFLHWFNEFVELLPTLLKLFKDTINHILESIHNIQEIYAQYYALKDEYCRQLDLVKDSVEIECGTTYPQDEEITIYIDGLGWKGTFNKIDDPYNPGEKINGETFTFTTPGDPEPLYEDLETREWKVQVRDCSTITAWSDVNIFYLADHTVNLAGKYVLVSSKYDKFRHILKIESQEQFRGDVDGDTFVRDDEGEELFTACTYTIVPWPKQEGLSVQRDSGIHGANVTLPVYGNPFAAGGMPTPTLLSPREKYVNPHDLPMWIWNYLYAQGVLPITEEELKNIQRLDQAGNLDNIINAPILFAMPTPRSIYTIIGSDVDAVLKVAIVPTEDWWTPVSLGDVVISIGGSITGDVDHGDVIIFKSSSLPEPLERDTWYTVQEVSGTKYLTSSIAAVGPIDVESSGTYTAYLYSPILDIEVPKDLHWVANPGAKVKSSLGGNVYVANLVPSEVVAVMAYKKVNDREVLMPLHPELYEYNGAEDLDGFTVTSLYIAIELADYQWSEQVYVSLVSTVGPNVVDVLSHLITTYTSFGIDAASFAEVRDLVNTYPTNFALFKKQNVLTQLHEIARLCCLELTLRNDTFYLTYLPTEPEAGGTLDNDTIIIDSLSVALNETVDLVTKMDITWREDYSKDSDLQFILRHNIAKYGLHEQDYDWYVYTDRNLVIKAATYWLLRLSNTWKNITFTTPLTTLTWDIGDAVDCEVADVGAEVKGILSSANYDITEGTISYEAWLPVRSGEQTQYQFAWPADVGEDVEFPTVLELEYSGSPGPGRTIATLPTGRNNT